MMRIADNRFCLHKLNQKTTSACTGRFLLYLYHSLIRMDRLNFLYRLSVHSVMIPLE